jgi:ParB family chromosome partitioning protein
VEQRRGLGRGLSALLEESENTVAEEPASVAGVRVAPIELLRRNPDQPRRSFPDEEIDGLATSIREKGLLQPILVRPAPGAMGEYQIVAGERRWRAAQRAGLRDVPIIVRELDDAETLEIAILENVQREDLNPVEEAGGYKALIERFGRTQEAVAQVVGKSRSHIANTLRLLALPEQVQTMLIDGHLSAGHARAIMTAEDPTVLAKAVVERGLNVRDTEALARQASGRARPARSAPRPAPAKDADTRALENDLSDVLGLAVEVIDQGGEGEVRIRYATLEQLDDLCRRLTRT